MIGQNQQTSWQSSSHHNGLSPLHNPLIVQRAGLPGDFSPTTEADHGGNGIDHETRGRVGVPVQTPFHGAWHLVCS